MTAEEFLDYIGEGRNLRCAGTQRLRLARERYRHYLKAYQVRSFADAYWLHLDRAHHAAIIRGLQDRDLGIVSVFVPDLL